MEAGALGQADHRAGVMKYVEPFPHWVVNDAFVANDLRAAAGAVPPAAWPHWVRYDTPDQRKRTTRDRHLWPGPLQQLFALLTRRDFIRQLEELTGITGLVQDPTLHGGGVHVTDAGGFLTPHLDYALHPDLPILQRRLNAIVYLSREWREEWGGATELWDDEVREVKARVYPAFGKLLLWEPSDVSYHGAQAVTCPAGVARVTAAVYYLGVAQPGVTRKVALFRHLNRSG